jgi:hypothetical protein
MPLMHNLPLLLRRKFRASQIGDPLKFFSKIAGASIGEKPVSVQCISPKRRAFLLHMKSGSTIKATILENRYGVEATHAGAFVYKNGCILKKQQ